MLRLRLKQQQSKDHYRIYLIDSRRPRDGKPLKQLGYCSRSAKGRYLYIDIDEFVYWLSRGAQPSSSMLKILEDSGMLEGDLLAKV